jgi:hypothetical protein
MPTARLPSFLWETDRGDTRVNSVCSPWCAEVSRYPSTNGDRSTLEFASLRERAREDGIAIEVEPVADGTRLAWSVPLRAA